MARAAIIVISLAIAWLVAGRRLALLLDHLITIRTTNLPIAPLEYDGGGFRIAGASMTFGATDNYRFPLQLSRDSNGRLTLSSGSRSFVLGRCQSPVDPNGRPEVHFASEPGDRLSFTSRTSSVGWPSLFDLKILSPRWPLWKRYVYYRLLWTKSNGARLEMQWRYERQYYRGTGWTAPAMMWNSQTGLLGVKISEGR